MGGVPIVKNIAGQHFGLLVALEHIRQNKHKKALWRCRCACGNVTQVQGGNLRSGNTTSCGCGRRKAARDEHGRFLPTRKTSIQEKLAPRGSEPSAPRSHRIVL
jgi:hypothetical protein